MCSSLYLLLYPLQACEAIKDLCKNVDCKAALLEAGAVAAVGGCIDNKYKDRALRALGVAVVATVQEGRGQGAEGRVPRTEDGRMLLGDAFAHAMAGGRNGKRVMLMR